MSYYKKDKRDPYRETFVRLGGYPYPYDKGLLQKVCFALRKLIGFMEDPEHYHDDRKEFIDSLCSMNDFLEQLDTRWVDVSLDMSSPIVQEETDSDCTANANVPGPGDPDYMPVGLPPPKKKTQANAARVTTGKTMAEVVATGGGGGGGCGGGGGRGGKNTTTGTTNTKPPNQNGAPFITHAQAMRLLWEMTPEQTAAVTKEVADQINREVLEAQKAVADAKTALAAAEAAASAAAKLKVKAMRAAGGNTVVATAADAAVEAVAVAPAADVAVAAPAADVAVAAPAADVAVAAPGEQAEEVAVEPGEQAAGEDWETPSLDRLAAKAKYALKAAENAAAAAAVHLDDTSLLDKANAKAKKAHDARKAWKDAKAAEAAAVAALKAAAAEGTTQAGEMTSPATA